MASDAALHLAGMLDLVVVAVVALAASALTFFSGFGLGTLLLPAFALFVPLPQAVALTAAVHLANNLLKLGLVGRHTQWRVALVFGVPAVLAAWLGAELLLRLADGTTLATYEWAGQTRRITAVRLVIAGLMVVFALWDLVPRLARLTFAPNWLPLGGLLSGFFGGLSGHQGALRAAFLIRLGLSKEAFIATGVVIAVLVDLARLPTYAPTFLHGPQPWDLLVTATLSAFLGAWLGSRTLHKVKLPTVQRIVGVLLLVLAVLIGVGVV